MTKREREIDKTLEAYRWIIPCMRSRKKKIIPKVRDFYNRWVEIQFDDCRKTKYNIKITEKLLDAPVLFYTYGYVNCVDCWYLTIKGNYDDYISDDS